jgi:hypothetical protein
VRNIHRYILSPERVPVPCDDLETWARFLDDVPRCRLMECELALHPETYRELGHSPIRVSTVFIGIDYSFGRAEQPLVFETMVFAGSLGIGELLNGCVVRTSSWDEAERAHALVVATINAALAVRRLKEALS